MKNYLIAGLLLLTTVAPIACDRMQPKSKADYDLRFIDTMSAHHQSGMDAAKLAQAKAQNPELKGMAGKMVSDSQREIDQLRQMRDQWYKDKPKAEDMEMTGMMDSMKSLNMQQLQSASGGDFDRMFLDALSSHHRGGVRMAQEARDKAEHDELKKIAGQIADSQQKELDAMARLKSAPGAAPQ